ncbi:MAG TPA: KamA family radical SAM protein [Planctomycetota bacterium]|nr:KamA family radical SAM protein [Planctomycetota bacterium]
MRANGDEVDEPPGTSSLAVTTNGHRPGNPNSTLDDAPEGRAADARGGAFLLGEAARRYRARCHPDAGDADWHDWRWQLRNRIRDLAGLRRALSLSVEETEAVVRLGDRLPVGITPYYAAQLDALDPNDGLRRTMVPVVDEFAFTAGELEDPLNEDGDMPVPGLVHRYPDRVLFLVTSFCATYCRYCTRSRLVGKTGEYHFNQTQYQRAIDYIASRPEIRDVLISGGDPLTMADDRLEWLLTRLRRIPHVEFVRIGSKVPVVLPQRITPELTAMLRKFHPLWMSVHFMHPSEVTPEVAEACGRLADAGIPLGSQTVLLRGVNDDVAVMRRLMQALLKIRVRPYYIYQCDPIPGSAHFRTPVEKGIEIIEGLRGHTTGYAVPQFVIDAPGGGGKIPLAPEYVVARDGDDVVLRNFRGLTFRYADPLPRPGAAGGGGAANGRGGGGRNGCGSNGSAI